MDDPIYPCYKGEGLCRLRTVSTDKFECVFTAATCRYRKVKKVKEELDGSWEKLQRGE